MPETKNFNFFLMPIVGVYLEKRYGLLLSHRIIEISSYIDIFSFITFQDLDRYLLSEIVNIIFILQNFKIVDNMYVQLHKTIDESVFTDLAKCSSLDELYAFLDYKYDTFLFYTKKQDILNFMQRLKVQCSTKVISDETSSEKKRPKRIDHIEFLMIHHKRVTTELTIQECVDSYNQEEYENCRNKFESMIMRLGSPLSNLLPYYYSYEYARSLMSDKGFLQWKKEKEDNTYVVLPEEIIHIEASRLIEGLDNVTFGRIIVYSKYKKQIWDKYKEFHNIA